MTEVLVESYWSIVPNTIIIGKWLGSYSLIVHSNYQRATRVTNYLLHPLIFASTISLAWIAQIFQLDSVSLIAYFCDSTGVEDELAGTCVELKTINVIKKVCFELLIENSVKNSKRWGFEWVWWEDDNTRAGKLTILTSLRIFAPKTTISWTLKT